MNDFLDFPPDNENDMNKQNSVSDSKNRVCFGNQRVISFMMGDAALTRGEISILCKRKSKDGSRGLTSNEIMSYLYLKLYSCNGWYRFFVYSDLSDYLGISKRDVYYILQTLERVKLIKVHGKKHSHFKKIHIFHKGVERKTRFLSLNRTYFRKGEDDYAKFSSLSAGPKSMLLYLLYMENSKPDINENAIGINVSNIVKFMGVSRQTAIRYIKEVNEVWPGFLVVGKCSYGSVNEKRLEEMADKRIRYVSLSSRFIFKRDTSLENISCGFWRYFDLFLKSHGISERTIGGRFSKGAFKNSGERMKNNRDEFFRVIYSAFTKNEHISVFSLFKTFMTLVDAYGGFDENVVNGLYMFLNSKDKEMCF